MYYVNKSIKTNVTEITKCLETMKIKTQNDESTSEISHPYSNTTYTTKN
jgi:hypothetical protein